MRDISAVIPLSLTFPEGLEEVASDVRSLMWTLQTAQPGNSVKLPSEDYTKLVGLADKYGRENSRVPGELGRLASLKEIDLEKCHIEKLPQTTPEDEKKLAHLEVDGCIEFSHLHGLIGAFTDLPVLSISAFGLQWPIRALGCSASLSHRKIWRCPMVVASQHNKGKRPKLADRGRTCMYIGYADEHASGVHRFLNLKTLKVITSRNVMWLGKNYGEWSANSMKMTQGNVNHGPLRAFGWEFVDPEVTTQTESADKSGMRLGPEGVVQDAREEETKEEEPVQRNEGNVELDSLTRRMTNLTIEGDGNSTLNTLGNPNWELDPPVPPERNVETERMLELAEEQGVPEVAHTQRGQVLPENDETSLNDEDVVRDESEVQSVRKHRYETRQRISKQRPRASNLTRLEPKQRRELSKLAGFFNEEAQKAIVSEPEEQKADSEASDSQSREGDDSNDDQGSNQVTQVEMLLASIEATNSHKWKQLDFEMGFYSEGEIEALRPTDIRPERYRDIFTVPARYENAWNHEDEYQRARWREAIGKEFTKMNDHSVWRKIKRQQMGKGRRCVKCRWVFDIKRNGTFRARLVACGYSQVPGIDFTDIYSPVLNDCTFRMMLVVQMARQYSSTLIDVETAFLHGLLDEEIYMECPNGMEHLPDECLLLLKTIYGLVKSAARAFYKRLVDVLKELGFVQSEADPCLLTGLDKNGELLMLGLYVDDIYMCGVQESIDTAIKEIGETFKLKVEKEVKDYLSCAVDVKQNHSAGWIGQPHLIKKLDDDFGSDVLKRQVYGAPGSPGCSFLKPKEGDELPSEQQKRYRSGVGMLLYLTKLTRPDLANSVRELSKGMTKANIGAYKEMERVIKYALDTRNVGLKMIPSGKRRNWRLCGYSDSDWAGDVETRLSVSGFVIFLQDCPIL